MYCSFLLKEFGGLRSPILLIPRLIWRYGLATPNASELPPNVGHWFNHLILGRQSFENQFFNNLEDTLVFFNTQRV